MDDPMAEDYLVRDISPEHGFRRWAFIRPEMRFRLQRCASLDFYRGVRHPGSYLKVTGPVTVSYAVNGRTLGRFALRSCRRFPDREGGTGRVGRVRQVHQRHLRGQPALGFS